MSTLWGRVLAVMALLVGCVGLTGTASAVDTQTTAVPLYLVFDTSGSMSETDVAGEAKIEKAKRAIFQLVHDLQYDQTFSLVTFPGGSGVREGCPDGNVRFGPGRIDKTKVAAGVRGFRADGETPIGPTLLHVRDLFKATGAHAGTVVLVSDGEANCGDTDVCEVARNLNDAGLALTVNTVGFDISQTGAEQLDCIAGATGGKSVRIEKDEDLLTALQLASRASLEVHVDAPTVLSSVTGTAELPPAVNMVPISVTSTGSEPARNVRISFAVTGIGGGPGAIYTPDPVRHLGNLGGAVPSANLTFRPRPAGGIDQARWTLVATADNAASVRLTETISVSDSTRMDSAGPLLTEARHVVIMGDSYSSGEGAGGYDAADNLSSDVYACHRSDNAYGRLLYGTTFRNDTAKNPVKVSMLACSGAVVPDLRRYQYLWGIKPQIAELSALTASNQPPDLVLMTLGGNDSGFVGFIQGCVMTGLVTDWHFGVTVHPCGADPDSWATEDVKPYFVSSTVITSLEQGYRDIDAILNSPKAVQRRSGRVAQILVLPYVNPLPPPERRRSGCFVGMADWELGTAQNFIDKINAAVARAIANTAAEGVPIRLVSTVESAFQNGHTMCDKTPAIRVDSVLVKKVVDQGPDEHRYGQELVHPNLLGQRLEAQAIIEWSRGQDAGWTTPHVPATQVPNQPGVQVEGRFWATYRRLIQQDPSLPSVLDFPRVPVPAAPLPKDCVGLFGEQKCIDIATWKVTMIHVESDPRPLITLIGPPARDFTKHIQLPADLPAGSHRLVATGVNANGTTSRYAAHIRVRPAGTNLRLYTLGLGLTFTILATIIIGRRGRHQTPSRQ